MAFDTVVVGGGTAGSVVAARLAELGSSSVALLEAGLDLRDDPPGDLRNGFMLERGLPDWGYISDAGGEPVRRGRLLGGTSWLTRFALRGQPADYDRWAAHGGPGWGFDEMLPWLRRLEADADFGGEPWHGDSGPMPVRRYLDVENAFESVLTFAPHGTATRIEMRTVFPTKQLRDEAVERYHAIEGGHQTLGNLAAYVTEIIRKGVED